MRKTPVEIRIDTRLAEHEFLENLGTGGLVPTDVEIAEAPFLYEWRINDSLLIGLRVDGRVTGHPMLDDGNISTSAPLHADMRRGWLRTRNTLYRLGAHF